LEAFHHQHRAWHHSLLSTLLPEHQTLQTSMACCHLNLTCDWERIPYPACPAVETLDVFQSKGCKQRSSPCHGRHCQFKQCFARQVRHALGASNLIHIVYVAPPGRLDTQDKMSGLPILHEQRSVPHTTAWIPTIRYHLQFLSEHSCILAFASSKGVSQAFPNA